MKFGVLGCRHGHIDQFIGEMLALDHTFVGICEEEGELAPRLASRYNVPLFSKREELFAQKPQVIGSSAVNNRKLSVLEACAAEGVSVLFDKPLVTTREDLRKADRIARESKIQVGLMLTERYNRGVLALRKQIETGALGKLIGFTIVKPHKLSPADREPWFFSREENGGPVVDLLIHDFDLLRFATGAEVEDAKGYMQIGNREGYADFPDDAKILVRMSNGITATLQTDWWTPNTYPCYGKGLIICTGTKGKCIVHSTGEPLLGKEGGFAELVTEEENSGILPDESRAGTLTSDFLSRVAGEKGLLTWEDIYKATEASLLADENIRVIRRS